MSMSAYKSLQMITIPLQLQLQLQLQLDKVYSII